MKPRERVWAALRGEAVDRPPVSFWGHFYDRESSAEDLVEATLEFQREYQWDWVKLNPRKHYHVEPWGVRYRYSGRNEKPAPESYPVQHGSDWRHIIEVPAASDALAEQISAVRMLRHGLPSETPLVETVFTPLAILGEMVRDPAELKSHLSTHPNEVRSALEAVTRTFEKFVAEIVAAGADGIFLATVDWASRDLMTPKEYRSWARPYDERILDVAASAPFNVLHVCKRNNLLLELTDYRVKAFSWSSNDSSNPSLRDALTLVPGAVMGGISQDEALQNPDPEKVVLEVRRAFEQTGGQRWLAAPGCSIPPASPAANLRAVQAAVETAHMTPHRST